MQLHIKRRLILLIAAAVIMLWTGTVVASAFTVVVNGRTVEGHQAEMRNGQLMVAVRPFVDAMGGSTYWSAPDRRVDLWVNNSRMALWIGNQAVYLDGKQYWAPVAPYLKNDRSMVPAWWLAVRLGGTPQFSGSTLTVAMPTATRPPALAHPLANPRYVFPFPTDARYEPYLDTMGAPRFWQGQQFTHEGIDIFARRGTPVVAVAPGKIVRYGWNTLGGYRVTIQLDDHPEYRFYYAHLDGYAPGLGEGVRVRAGQLLGYVGSTGEGPERTEGKFPNHLHFGVYGPSGAINPFELLRYWEKNRVGL